MFDLNNLPKSISDRINGFKWICDDIGMSDSTVLIFDEMVLKIEKLNPSSVNEKILLEWLNGKLTVPKIIQAEIADGYSFLLLTKLSGEMACSDNCLNDMNITVKALASGLKTLWQIDITHCPCFNTLSDKILQAKNNIDNNLLDMDNFNPKALNKEGFTGALELFDWLNKNRPEEEFVFSHGDFCLPNIFVKGCKTTGFLDLGSGGIADKWHDIALCVRSLRYNYIKHTGCGEKEFQKYQDLLFNELELEPDEEKIRYYIFLDKFF